MNIEELFKLDSEPSLVPIDTQKLKSLWLESDRTFQYLKQQIEIYNKEILKHTKTGQAIEHSHFKQQLYYLLHQQLEEIVNTSSRLTQQRFLKDTQLWYNRQLLTIRKNMSFSATNAGHPFNKALSLEYTASECQKDYDNQNRTKYSDMNPPEER